MAKVVCSTPCVHAVSTRFTIAARFRRYGPQQRARRAWRANGEVLGNGVPRRFGDTALIADWNQGFLTGPVALLKPLFGWAARRARARGRDAELLRRYDAAL